MPEVASKITELMTEKDLKKALETKSPYLIAAELKTNANKIRRMARRYGITLKTRGEAQKLALQNGKEHPTQGKKVSQETKEKIGSGVSDTWINKPETEKKVIRKKHKANWDAMSDIDKENFHRAAAIAIRDTAKNGSKTEKFLFCELTKHGYVCEFHKKNLLPNEKLEIDIFIPSLSIAIEVNGLSHYEPIRGQDSLEKTQRADTQKYGLLVSNGMRILVIKLLVKDISEVYHRKLLALVIEQLEEIKKNPPQEGKIIEVQV